jgi:HK97 gp10 family phage protein
MSLTITPSSRKAVLRIENLHKLTKSGVEHAAYTSGRGLVKTTSAQILKSPKGGKTYIRRDRAGRRRRHIASAAGQSIANQTGATRRSLSFKAGFKQIEFGYGVAKNDAPDYAQFPEFGTSKMKARPSLQNGIKSERRNFQNNFEREIGKRLEGRGGFSI